MALIISARNPEDRTNTYDQVEFHRSDTSGGSFSIVSTKDIDTSTITDLSPGYTSYTDATGDSTKYYKVRWKNSVSSAVGALSDEFQGETTVLDSRFRRTMRDTNAANYFFTNDDVVNFRKDAIYSLWPHAWQEGYDDSITSDDTKEIYDIPAGVTRINKIQLIDDDGTKVANVTDYEVQSSKIIFPTAPSGDYTMRLWVEKMFTKSEEVPEAYDSYLLEYMSLQAYRVLEADRTRYYKYTTVAKPDNGGISNIRDIIIRLEASTERRLNALRRLRKTTEMGLQ
jgi:hypothetical protein